MSDLNVSRVEVEVFEVGGAVGEEGEEGLGVGVGQEGEEGVVLFVDADAVVTVYSQSGDTSTLPCDDADATRTMTVPLAGTVYAFDAVFV
jgi:hypothetical protein